MIPVIADCFIFQIDIDGFSSIGPRASKARSAQFNLFPLPSIPRADVVPRLESPTPLPTFCFPLLARPVLGHTVKDLFRGD
jgi:hypothetical protein